MNQKYILSLFIIIGHAYLYENQNDLSPDDEKTFTTQEDQLEFENWALENNRHYDNQFTQMHRMQIFFENKRDVERFNRNHFDELKKLNSFSDLDKNEFRHLMFMHIELGDEPNQSPLHLFDHETSYGMKTHPSFLDMQSEVVKKKNQNFPLLSIGLQMLFQQGIKDCVDLVGLLREPTFLLVELLLYKRVFHQNQYL